MSDHSAPSVAIVGASNNPERASNHAVSKYQAAGYTVWPVHPSGNAVNGVECFTDLENLPGKPDIISLYVNPKLGAELIDQLKELQPQAVWLNPGADSDELENALREANLLSMRSCNLVALSLGDPMKQIQEAQS